MPACPWRRRRGPSIAYSKRPSSGSKRLQVDSPMRTTLRPGSFHQCDIFVEADGLCVRGYPAHVFVVVGSAVKDGGEVRGSFGREWTGLWRGRGWRRVQMDVSERAFAEQRHGATSFSRRASLNSERVGRKAVRAARDFEEWRRLWLKCATHSHYNVVSDIRHQPPERVHLPNEGISNSIAGGFRHRQKVGDIIPFVRDSLVFRNGERTWVGVRAR